MKTPIRVDCITIREMLSQKDILVLPWSQRGFAWGPDHILRLIDDLMLEIDQLHRGYYSLGHVCYSHGETPGQIELVDGNQRTTSLLIILAIWRDLSTDPALRAEIDRLIWMGDRAGGGHGAARLRVQEHSRKFFEMAVLELGASTAPRTGNDELGESERNILECRDDAAERLKSLPEAKRNELGAFLLARTWVIRVGVATADEAWAIIQNEEDRGLHHHPADLLKFRIVNEMPGEHQASAAAAWDQWQVRLGSDVMLQLMGTIRALETSKRSSRPLDFDIVKIFNLRESGQAFIAKTLVPRAESLESLRSLEVDAGSATPEVARCLRTMSWIGQHYWTIPAIRWLEERGAKHPDTASFFWHLDRFAWMTRIGSSDPGQNERRFIRVLSDIDVAPKAAKPPSEWDSLKITKEIRDSALQTLRSKTFEEKHVCGPLMRRISFEYARTLKPDVSDQLLDHGPVNETITTTEHILPRSVPVEGTIWASHFNGRDGMREYAFRLGNLAFLTCDENQEAGVQDFSRKRVVFARSRHWLAQEAATWPAWDHRVIQQRTDKLIELLFRTWKLRK